MVITIIVVGIILGVCLGLLLVAAAYNYYYGQSSKQPISAEVSSSSSSLPLSPLSLLETKISKCCYKN